MRLFLLVLLLSGCGGAAPPLDAVVHVTMVPRASIPNGGIGWCEPVGDGWNILVADGMNEGITWVNTAHELLHVLGLPSSHGEPYPCLGNGVAATGPLEMVVCEGDYALLASARERGEHHVVHGPECAQTASEFLNGLAGTILFTWEPTS